MDIYDLIRSYKSHTLQMDHSIVVEYRQMLSIAMHEIGEEIASVEEEHKPLEARIKLQRSILELQSKEKSADKRRGEAFQKLESEILREAQLNGRLRALRIKFESLQEVSNSMASYLKVTQ